MKKFTALFLLFTTTLLYVHSQDVDNFEIRGGSFEDDIYLGIGINKVSLSNGDIVNSENHKNSGYTIKFDMKKMNHSVGERSWTYENKWLGDLCWYLAAVIKDEASVFAEEGTTFTNSLIGRYTTTWNINNPGIIQFHVGVNGGDYGLIMRTVEDENKVFSNPGNILTPDPAGVYYTVGPSAGARFNLFNIFLVNFRSDLAIPFAHLKTSSDSYQKTDSSNPYFVSHSVEFVSKAGIFLGFERWSIINRTNNNYKPRRTEINLGYKVLF